MIAYRRATPEDRVFVASSWEASYRKSNTAGIITFEDWATVMRDQIAKYLDRSGAICVTAYSKGDPGHVYGWAAGEPGESPPLLYYVYVKAPYRRQRLATGLIRALGIDPQGRWDYACSTPVVSRLAHHVPLARWNPIRARYSKEHRER